MPPLREYDYDRTPLARILQEYLTGISLADVARHLIVGRRVPYDRPIRRKTIWR